MATYDSTASRGYYIRLNVNYGNYDIPNNRTPVSWSMTLHSTGYNFGAHTSKANVSINGTSRLSTNQQYTIGKYSSITLGSGSGIWVTHGADGKKTMPFSASFDVVSKASYTPATILTVSGNLVLPTIPRTSSFTAPTSYTMGSNFTVTISRATTAFTHGIKVTYGSTVLYNVSGVATSQSVAVNHTALYNATPTVTSAALVITVTTFSGSTAIGSVTRNITANNGTRPSAGTLTHAENIEDIKNYFGFYIQGKSRLNMSISGEKASTGASIKSYSIAVDGQTLSASSGVTQYIRGSGTLAGSYSVTDSRNYVASGTFSISVAAYTPPTITSTRLYRTDSAGTPDDYGTFAKFELGFRITALNDLNTKSVNITAGSQTTGNVTVGTYTGTYVAQLSGFNVNNSYNITFRVNDYFGNSQSPQILPSGAITMMWGRKTTSFGKAIDNTSYNIQAGTGGIDNDGNYHKNGVDIFKLIYPVGSIYMSTTNTNPSTFLGGTWAVWGAGRVPVGVDTSQTEFNTPDKTGGAKTHTLTIDEMPSHSHTGNVAIAWGAGGPPSDLRLDANGGKNRIELRVNSTGGSKSHNNLQPFITCYMWRRTA